MSLAFSTIIILLLAIPGIVFRRGYYSSRFSITFIKTNLTTEALWSIAPAFLFHSVSFWYINKYTSHTIIIEDIGYLMAGANGDNRLHDILLNYSTHLLDVVKYNVFIAFIAYLTGNLLRCIVRGLSLDTYIRVLQYPNKWHYIFTGEYKTIERGNLAIKSAFRFLFCKDEVTVNLSFLDRIKFAWGEYKFHNRIDFVYVDALVVVNSDNPIIYSGKFHEYFLENDGGLNRIIIKYPAKKTFNVNGGGETTVIASDYLVIPYNQILNINFSYYRYEIDESGEKIPIEV